MPTVRAADYPYQPYATQQPSTTVPTAYQDVRAPIGAFGGATAEALTQLGSTFERASDKLAAVALERQDLQNRIVADQQISSFENNVNKVMYGDPDKPGDVGYMGLKGQAALDQRAPTRARIDEILQQHQAVLQNPHQRLAFDTQSRRYRNYVLNDVGRHYDSEFNRWGTEVTTGRAAVALGNAGIAANNDDFDGWKAAFGTGRAALQDGLQGLGHPQELVDAKLKDFDEKAVTDWAQKLATRDPVKADKFIDANREYLPGKYDDLKRQVKVQADKAMATEIATGSKAPRGTPDLVRGGKSGEILAKYAEGNAVPGGPSSVEGVDPEFATRIDTMVQAMPPEIRDKFKIISGYRDEARQAVVNPGVKNSKHTDRYAVDTTEDPAVINWINNNGKQFGVDYTIRHLPNEQNHLEMLNPQGGRMQGRSQSRAQLLGTIAQSESGNQNIEQNIVPAGKSSASGFYQITDETWLEFGKKAGVDTEVYGRAIDAPRDVQTKVANAILDSPNGLARWTDNNAKLRTQLGAAAPVGLPKVDELLSNLPEKEPGEIPDADLGAAYKQSLETAAKRAIAAGAPISVWQGAVKMLRQQYNAAYVDQQRQERMVLQEQHKKDESIKDQFLRRMDPDADNPPTVGEILRSDMSTAAKENTVGFLTARAQPGPTPRISASNQTDLFARIHAPDEAEDKIRSEDPINLAYKEKKITWEARKELINDFRDTYTSTKAEWARAEADVLKAVKHTIRPSLMLPHGELIEQTQDPDGADREVRFKRFVDQQVKETVQAGKDPTKTVLNPDSPEYVGKQVNRFTKAGPGLFNKVNEGAGKQSFAVPKSLSEVQAQFKSGRFGPPGSQEAQDAAFAEAVRLGFATPRAAVAVPVR